MVDKVKVHKHTRERARERELWVSFLEDLEDSGTIDRVLQCCPPPPQSKTALAASTNGNGT